jgi:hypothetical protein
MLKEQQMSNAKLEMTLVMEPAEAVAIVNLLGSLPTSQGGFPLWQKLKAQVEAQMPKDEPKPEQMQ